MADVQDYKFQVGDLVIHKHLPMKYGEIIERSNPISWNNPTTNRYLIKDEYGFTSLERESVLIELRS